jgi:UDP-2,4-diacetamido-2,4,6-trideoxy-beta-L-altropyranose hydrolase
MRCLTLADALRKEGANVKFVCREYDGNLCERIERDGYEVARLAPMHAPAATSAWIGPTAEVEAAETRKAIAKWTAPLDWLIFDHYAIDRRVERSLRDLANSIMVIDDLANREHDCDVLLDQNLVAQMDERYAGKIPDHCALLLGPRFSLLQPLYAKLRASTRLRSGAIRRVFVFFSGADVNNLTELTIRAFLRLQRSDVHMDVVATHGHPYADSIRQSVATSNNVTLHFDLASLAPLMAAADLAIGAGGSTSWERACLGLPSIVITMAENQRPVAEELSSQGIVHWLGDQSIVTETLMETTLRTYVETGIEVAWSARCSAAVDGIGADRVCAMLTLSQSGNLRARAVTIEDESLLLEWANDPLTRRNAFSSESIASGTHAAWLLGRLAKTDACRFFVVESMHGVPVGQARFDRCAEYWEIDYAVAPLFRGKKLGAALLKVALRKLRDEIPDAVVVGRVKPTNLPSCRVFESLGFRKTEDDRGIVYRSAE